MICLIQPLRTQAANSRAQYHVPFLVVQPATYIEKDDYLRVPSIIWGCNTNTGMNFILTLHMIALSANLQITFMPNDALQNNG